MSEKCLRDMRGNDSGSTLQNWEVDKEFDKGNMNCGSVALD